MRPSIRSWTPSVGGVVAIALGLLAVGLLAGTIAGPVAEEEDNLGGTEVVLAPASEYATINDTTGELEVRLDGTASSIDGDGVNVGYTTIEDLVIVRNDGESPKRVQFQHEAGETVTFGAETPGDIEGSGIVLGSGERVVVGTWVEAPDATPGSTLLETVTIVVDATADEEASEAGVSNWDADLRIVDLAVPETAQVGDQVTVEATVENRGSDPGIGTVGFEFENRSVTEERVVIEAGQRQRVPIEVGLSRIDAGEYRVSAALQNDQHDAWITVEEPGGDSPAPAPPAQPEQGSKTHVLTSETAPEDRRLPMLPVTVIGLGTITILVLLRRG